MRLLQTALRIVLYVVGYVYILYGIVGENWQTGDVIVMFWLEAAMLLLMLAMVAVRLALSQVCLERTSIESSTVALSTLAFLFAISTLTLSRMVEFRTVSWRIVLLGSLLCVVSELVWYWRGERTRLLASISRLLIFRMIALVGAGAFTMLSWETSGLTLAGATLLLFTVFRIGADALMPLLLAEPEHHAERVYKREDFV